jgi:hypothetical protein
MQTVFSGQEAEPIPNSVKLNCTANDIRLSKAVSVSPETCTKGAEFTLTATFETIVTAHARYAAGFYFNIKGGPNARLEDKQCSLSVLTAVPPPGPALDLDGDSCGDLNAGTYNLTITIPGVLCNDSDGDGVLNLPNCTSWHSNSSTVCQQATADDKYGTLANNADPDTKSKCVCDDTFQVPVKVEEAKLTVVKSASTASVPETGLEVLYTVKVTNTASIESVKIETVKDDIYGDLTVLPSCGDGQPPPTCTPSGTGFTSCASLVGVTLGPGDTASCEFKAFVFGNSGQTIRNTVEVCSYQESTQKTVCGDDFADVDITDVFTAPKLTKAAQSAECQTDVKYQVTVSNPSTVDTLTVTALTDDKFGDITQAHAATNGFEQVVSTTCVPDSDPATCEVDGTILPGSSCTCTFVGRIIDKDCNFTHKDTATAKTRDGDKHCSTNNSPEAPPPEGVISCLEDADCPSAAPNCVENQSSPYGSATVTLSMTGLAQ